MNLVINTHPLDDDHSLSGALAGRLAGHLNGETRTVRLYRHEQRYFDFTFNEEWIALVKEARRLIFPVPMWNFTVPAALKDFFDKITKQGETWDIREGRFVGLVPDKPAFVIMTSGGHYPPGAVNDFLTPYMRCILSFIGIERVAFYRVSRVSDSPALIQDEAFMEKHTRAMLSALAVKA